MKIDPCLDCGFLGFREDDEPAPERCQRCNSPNLLKPDPATGRASHPEDARRLIAEYEKR